MSRAEIERLILLHAVGLEGCTPAELPARLGLSPGLADALLEAAQALVDEGMLLILADDRLVASAIGWGALQSCLARCATVLSE